MLRSIFRAVTNQTRVLGGRSAYCTKPSRFDTEDYSISDSDSERGGSDGNNISDIKKKILDASLPFVHEHGWTNKSLAFGAEKLELSSMSHGMFPLGGYELVSHFYRECNGKLEEKMKEDTSKEEMMKTPEFVEGALKYRLNLITPYILRWPEAMVLMVQPRNIGDSFNNFTSLVDDIWYHAGDRSFDLNWYTKRFALGLIYKSSELSLITDESENFEETWKFLSRRIKDVENVKICRQQLEAASGVASSLFQVARNVLSLNDLRRK